MPRTMEPPRSRKRKKTAPKANPFQIGAGVGATSTLAKPKPPKTGAFLAQRAQRIKTDPYLKKTAARIGQLANAYKSDPRDPAGQIISRALKDGTMHRYDREIRYGGNSARKALEARARAAGLDPQQVSTRAASILKGVRVEKTYGVGDVYGSSLRALNRIQPRKTGINPLKIGSNFLLGAAKMTYSAPEFGKQLAKDPKGTAKAMGKSYQQRYRHLAHGQLGEFAGDLSRDPASYVADVAMAKGGMKLVGKGAAKAGLKVAVAPRKLRYVQLGKDAEGKVIPGTRRVYRTKPISSPHPVSRAAQNLGDRLSERISAGRVKTTEKNALGESLPSRTAVRKERVLTALDKTVGATGRTARAWHRGSQIALDRAVADAEPFITAAAKLKKSEKPVYTPLQRYAGGKQIFTPENLSHTITRIDQEIAAKKLGAGEARGTSEAAIERQAQENARSKQTRMEAVKALEEVKKTLVHAANNPKARARIEEAVRQGRALDAKDTTLAIDEELLRASTAVAHNQMHSRLVSGGKMRDIPAETPLLKQRRAKVTYLEGRVAKKTAQVEKRQAQMIEKSGGSAAAEEARLAKAQKAYDEYVVKVHDKRYGKTLSPESNKLQRHRNTVNGILAKGPGKKGYARAQREAATWGTGNVHLENMRNAEDAAMAALEKAAKTDPKAAAFLRDVETLNARKLADTSTPFDVTPASKAEAPKLPLQKGFGRGQMIGPHPAGGGRIIYPKGHADLERHLSALSLAREDLARSEAAQLGRDPKNVQHIIEGGETSPGAWGSKDVPLGTRASRRAASAGLMRGKSPIKRSTATLFRRGTSKMGPEGQVVRHYELARYLRHKKDLDTLVKHVAIPLDARYEALGGVRPGYRVMDLNEIKRVLPSVKRQIEQLGASDLSFAERRAATKELYDQLEGGIFPKEPGPEARLVQVPEGFIDQLLKARPSGGKGTSHALHVIDTLNNFARVGYVFAKPSYIPLNFAGNAAFGVIQQGARWPESMRQVKSLSAETQGRILHEVGQGGARSLSAPAGGKVASLTNRLIQFQGRHADDWTRSASFVYEARRAGYKGEAGINHLLTDPKLRSQLDQVSAHAQDMAVKFGASAAERATISRVVFIYPWMKGATRYIFTLPRDHPLRAALLYELAQGNEKRSKKAFGRVQNYITAQGLMPIGGHYKRGGSVMQDATNMMAWSPWGTGAQMYGLGKDIVTGKPVSKMAAGPLESLTPPLRSAIEAGTGKNLVTGQAYTGGIAQSFVQSLVGTPDSPGIPALSALKTALEPGAVLPKWAPFGLGKIRSPGLIGGDNSRTQGPISRQANMVPEHGPWSGFVKGTVGSARTRTHNLTVEQLKGKDEYMSSLPRAGRAKVKSSAELSALQKIAAKDRVKINSETMAGLQARSYLRQRIAVERDKASGADVADNGSLAPRAVYRLEAKILLENGKIDQATHKESVAWSKSASDKEIKTGQQSVENIYFGRASTAKLRKEFRDKGYKLTTVNVQ